MSTITCQARVHGTQSAYRRHRCRCPQTLAEMRPRWRRWRANRAGRIPQDPAERAYVDEVAVERACAGRPVRLTTAERAVAIDHLDQQGLSARLIAERLRITERTVVRHRARRCVPATPVATEQIED